MEQQLYSVVKPARPSAALALLGRLALLLALCGMLAGPTLPAHAEGGDGRSTYYVAPGGNCGGTATPCYASIQAAVNAADEPTDVIKVAKGTYAEFNTLGGMRQVVYINKQLILRGGYTTTDWVISRPVTNTTIIDAGGGGRGVAIVGKPVTLDGFTITNGNATGLRGYAYMGAVLGDAGGGIYVLNAAAVIKNCDLHHNKATTSALMLGAGGAIFALNSPVTIVANVIRENTGNTAYAGSGGGLALAFTTAPISVTGNVVRQNTASLTDKGFGGGMSFDSATANVSANVIQDNTASLAKEGFGGGVYGARSTLNLSANTLRGNTAGKAPAAKSVSGGGLYATDCGLTISANQFFTNTANAGNVGGYGLGGGLYVERYDWGSTQTGEAITLTNNIIDSNVASKSGSGFGGGACLRSTIALVSANTLRNNIAGLAEGSGGGLFLGPSEALTATTRAAISVTRNVFQGNQAATSGAGKGGGVYIGSLPPVGASWDVISNTVLADNTITSNTASLSGLGKGGGLLLGNGTDAVSALHNLILGNKAANQGDGYGGGLYLDGSGATVTGNTIQGNTASSGGKGYGGGLGAQLSMPTLTANTFLTNTASISGQGVGGGVYLSLTQADLTANTLRGNVASSTGRGSGGGLYMSTCNSMDLNENTIVLNMASTTGAGYGGGVYSSYSAPLRLVNNIIGGNQARSEGSGLWLRGANPATFIYNTIASNGGAGQGLYASASSIIVCTNTIIAGHAQAGLVITGTSSVQLAYTLWDGNGANATTHGGSVITRTDDLTGAPDFVAAASGDFHLNGHSAAIDKGVNAGVATDVDGDTRPYLSGYDLGADEFTGTIPVTYYAYLPVLRGRSVQ